MLIEAAAGGAFTKLMEPIVNETFVVKNATGSLLLPAAIVGLFVLRGIAGYITDVQHGARRARHRPRSARAGAGQVPAPAGIALRYRAGAVDAAAAGVGQRPGRAGRDRCGQGDVAAVVPDHRLAGGDAVDQLAGDGGDPGAGAAAGLGDGQRRAPLPPRQPQDPGKRRATDAGRGPDVEQSPGSEGLRRAKGRTSSATARLPTTISGCR